MEKLGGLKRKTLLQKSAGGAQMLHLGKTWFVKLVTEMLLQHERLNELEIPIVSEDAGGNHGHYYT